MENIVIFQKLKQEINNELKSLQIKIGSNNTQEELLKDVNSFLLELEQGNLHADLFIKFQDKISPSFSLEYIQLVWNSISELDPSIFSSQIEKCKKIIFEFIKEVNSLKVKLQKEVETTKVSLQKFIDKETKCLRMLGALELDGFTKLIDKDLSNDFIEFAKEHLSKEEVFQFVFLLAKHNEVVGKKIIEEKIADERRLQEERERVEKERIKITEKNVVPQNKEIKFENEEYQKMYLTAQKLVGSYDYLKENRDIIECVLPALKNAKSVEERVSNYKLVEDTRTQLELILFDLKDNVLATIEKEFPKVDDSLFSLVAFLLESYELVLRTKTWNEKAGKEDLSTILSGIGMNQEADIYVEAQKVEQRLNSYLQQKYQANSYQPKRDGKIYVFVNEFHNIIEEYTDALTLLLSDPFSMLETEYKEFIITAQKNMVEKIEYSRTILGELEQLNDKTIESGSEELVSDFYGAREQVHHLVLLLSDNNSQESFLETDIMEDKNLNDGYRKSIITELSKRSKMTHQEFELSNDHKIKTSNYSDDFLKKYHIKSISDGKNRIFFAKFKTNISKRFKDYPEDLSIMIVLSAGFGALSENSKRQLYEDSLRRCYAYAEDIDRIVDFLNPNWDTMTEQEAIRTETEIRKFLISYDEKIAHLINTVQSKDKKRR